MQPQIVLKIRDLHACHAASSQAGSTHTAGTPVLQGISLDLYQGEVLVIVGPSGGGKTTFLRCLAGLHPPSHGRIEFHDGTVWSAAADPSSRKGKGAVQLDTRARNVGLVFQDYALYPHLTVADNLAFGLAHLPAGDRQQKVSDVAKMFAIEPYLLRYPGELSGGQQQRVAVARSVVRNPALLLLDEPFSNLDPLIRAKARTDLFAELHSYGGTKVLVTHNPDDALAVASRIAVIEGGRLVELGTPLELLHRPQSRFAVHMFGMFAPIAENLARALVSAQLVSEGEGLRWIDGTPYLSKFALQGRLSLQAHPAGAKDRSLDENVQNSETAAEAGSLAAPTGEALVALGRVERIEPSAYGLEVQVRCTGPFKKGGPSPLDACLTLFVPWGFEKTAAGAAEGASSWRTPSTLAVGQMLWAQALSPLELQQASRTAHAAQSAAAEPPATPSSTVYVNSQRF